MTGLIGRLVADMVTDKVVGSPPPTELFLNVWLMLKPSVAFWSDPELRLANISRFLPSFQKHSYVTKRTPNAVLPGNSKDDVVSTQDLGVCLATRVNPREKVLECKDWDWEIEAVPVQGILHTPTYVCGVLTTVGPSKTLTRHVGRRLGPCRAGIVLR